MFTATFGVKENVEPPKGCEVVALGAETLKLNCDVDGGEVTEGGDVTDGCNVAAGNVEVLPNSEDVADPNKGVLLCAPNAGFGSSVPAGRAGRKAGAAVVVLV